MHLEKKNSYEKLTEFHVWINEKEVNGTKKYVGGLSAVFQQTTKEKLLLLLDERLRIKQVFLSYFCCLVFSTILFLVIFFRELATSFTTLALFLLATSIFYVFYGYYKVHYVYLFSFEILEKKFLKSRIHLKSKEDEAINPVDIDIDNNGKILKVGRILNLLCYKGNIATGAAFSLFLISGDGSRVKICNTRTMEQVLDYGNMLSRILKVPLNYEKYGFNKDWGLDHE